MSSASVPAARQCSLISPTSVIFYEAGTGGFLRRGHTRHTLPSAGSLSPCNASSPAPRILLLCNAHAGGSRSGFSRTLRCLETVLREAGYISTVQHSLHAGFWAGYLGAMSSETLQGYAAVVAVGGDGTLHEIVNALLLRTEMQDLPPLAVAPAGTGNAVAVSMGIENALTAALNVVHGVRVQRRKRVGMLEWMGEKSGRKWAVGGVQWGFTAQVDVDSEKWRWMGDKRFEVGAVREIWRKQAWKARITVTVHKEKDQRMWSRVQEWRGQGNIERGKHVEENVYVMEGRFVLAVAWSCAYLGKDFVLTPFADIEEYDVFDFVVVEEMKKRTDMIKVLGETKQGTWVKWLHEMKYFKATKVHFEYIEGDYLTVDGEQVDIQPFVLQTPDHTHKQLCMLNEFKPEPSHLIKSL